MKEHMAKIPNNCERSFKKRKSHCKWMGPFCSEKASGEQSYPQISANLTDVNERDPGAKCGQKAGARLAKGAIWDEIVQAEWPQRGRVTDRRVI